MLPEYKKDMTIGQRRDFEKALRAEYLEAKTDTEKDLQFRQNGISATRGSSGKQFVGYTTLEQFYRGDQWDHDEPPGASQKTENYCAVIVDNYSSLLYDAPVEIHCPVADETDEVLEMKAEMKEKLLQKVYDDNDADDIEFPHNSKTGSQYGDSFIAGPFLDKCGSSKKEDWKIRFFNVEDPACVRLIFSDLNYNELDGFILTTPISAKKMIREYGDRLRERGIDPEKLAEKSKTQTRPWYSSGTQQTNQKMVNRSEYWTSKDCSIYINDELVDHYHHDWGFVPIQHIKNIYVPNHPYGKSDIEDAIDPQMFHTVVNNDMANAIKFFSTINMKGKNLDGMEVLVHGLSKIFNLPDEGELDAIERSGDPYASSNFVSERRRAILDVSGVSEALMSTVSNNATSGRAFSLALQSVIRKLNPRIKAHKKALRHLNINIFKLYELYWPETKEIIMGDYTNKVEIISTLLRNIIDELNKLQAGVQSLTTTQTNLGIAAPKIEQKRIKRDLMDPILGPQIARQPGLLNPGLASPTTGEMGSTGESGGQLPSAPGQQTATSTPEGAAVARTQQAGGVTPPAVNP